MMFKLSVYGMEGLGLVISIVTSALLSGTWRSCNSRERVLLSYVGSLSVNRRIVGGMIDEQG